MNLKIKVIDTDWKEWKLAEMPLPVLCGFRQSDVFEQE